MSNDNENSGFNYTYSAKEQDEIKKIREKYTHRDDDRMNKMDKLRRLDRRVYQIAQTVSLTFGIVGVLILGLGMSLVMSELSAIIGFEKDIGMFLGVIIGVLGGLLASFAYPMYNYTLQRERKKIAPEIIRLTDELMK